MSKENDNTPKETTDNQPEEIEAEVSSPEQQFGELLDDFETARTSATEARRTVVLSALVVLTAFPIYAAIVFNDFISTRLETFYSQLALHTSQIVSIHSPRLSKMVDNVYPHYLDEFQKMSEKEFPRLIRGVEKQIGKLQNYADAKKPLVEARLEKLVMARLEQAITRLEKASGKQLTAEEAARITDIYKERLRAQSDKLFVKAFVDHKHIVDKLEKSLHRLEQSEPDLAREVAPEEAVGILLEFAGVELQSEQGFDDMAVRAMLMRGN